MFKTNIKNLSKIDMQVTTSNEKEISLNNGTKVFSTTLKRTRPILPGK
ncbi:hypothetical protein [Neobacillus mesonae]|nr:hypothetical protein [Neobacillus mesonae]MCM3570242.1 hypothetical protein [Neobacillus mesonae]